LTSPAPLVYLGRFKLDPKDQELLSISSVEPKIEEHTYDSTLDSVDTAETIVLKEAQEMGFDEDDLHKIGMSIRECMVNAVVHGNRYNARKKVFLTIARSPGRLEIRIADEGDHFDMSQLPDPLADENLLRHSGRGLLLMQAFMDEFQIRPRQPKGTEVKLVKTTAKAG
jgi:serine/threonine-protein kinase RsbW